MAELRSTLRKEGWYVGVGLVWGSVSVPPHSRAMPFSSRKGSADKPGLRVQGGKGAPPPLKVRRLRAQDHPLADRGGRAYTPDVGSSVPYGGRFITHRAYVPMPPGRTRKCCALRVSGRGDETPPEDREECSRGVANLAPGIHTTGLCRRPDRFHPRRSPGGGR